MGSLFERITDWIKEGLIDAITGQYTSIFNSVNNQVADVANQVGQTPQGWNGGVFSMIQNLSETVVIPIAGMILTFVLVYELIQMILEKNNMHEFDTFNIFKWIFKTFVATYLLTNCFTIVMAVFDVAQNVVSQSAGVINGNLDVQAALSDLKTQLEAMGMWELIGLWLETNIINLCMWVLSIVIFVIVYGRMIEIYLTVSLAPIPFSTMANREWGQMGTGYLRSLFALGFQGFLSDPVLPFTQCWSSLSHRPATCTARSGERRVIRYCWLLPCLRQVRYPNPYLMQDSMNKTNSKKEDFIYE